MEPKGRPEYSHRGETRRTAAPKVDVGPERPAESWQRPFSPEFPPLAQMFIESLATQISEHHEISSGLLVAHQGLLSPELMAGMGNVSLKWTQPNDFDPKKAPKTRLLVNLPPWGVNGQRPHQLFESVAEASHCLSEDGWGITMLPGFYRAFRQFDLDEILRRQGFCLHAIINTPNRFLRNALHPIFVVVSRSLSDRVFVIDCQGSHDVNLMNFLRTSNSEDIRSGIWINLADFTSFEHWSVQKEIASLEGDFGKFNKYVLSEIASVQMTRSGDDFSDIPGCAYLPTIGNGPAIDSLSLATMKHHNYLQLVVNDKLATPEYLCAYFNSKHFRLYLEAEKSSRDAVIPKLTKQQALTLPISLPGLDMQRKVTQNLSKLRRLREMVEELTQLIAVNPLAEAQANQIDEALSVFGRLTQEEQVISLIREGESKTLEFKETLSLNRHREGRDKDLETAVVKTIGAFLNSEGGELLIGVRDDGEVVGLSEEIQKFHRGRDDTFLLHLKNLLREKIGAEHYTLFDSRMITVKGQRILRVSCKPSTTEVFVNETEFYVRTNPATDKLEGRKMLAYIQTRFPSGALT